MDTDSTLLLSLYRQARSVTTAEFQDFAVKLIRPILRFESAIWGMGYFAKSPSQGPQLVPISAHSHEIDPEGFRYWKSINRSDKVIPVVRKAPGKTFNFNAPAIFSGKDDAVMRDYARRFGRQNYLCTALTEHEETLFEWCSLYRADPDDQFTATERARCETLVNHLCEALKVNRLIQGEAGRTMSAQVEDSEYTALASAAGTLLSAQQGFLQTCAKQWREFDGRSIPRVVVDQLLGAGAGIARLSQIVVRARPCGEFVWLRVRAVQASGRLPSRRMDVATLFAKGYPYKEIARTLGIAPSTVRNQIAASYRVFGVHTRASLRDALQKEPMDQPHRKRAAA